MNNKLIPELRFPEFLNDGDWTEKRISDIGETINGLSGKSGEDFGVGKPYVTYKQVFDNSIIDFEKCGKVQISENEKQNVLQKGDILFTTSSETPNEVGFASILASSPIEKTYLNSFCFSLRPFSLEETRPEFARYLFHSPTYRNGITTLAQGSTRYNISKVAFLKLKIPIPNPQEQQKIASCLSSLDEVITGYNQKLELLKVHKKGLMQNLFPQDGEKFPKYRFPAFENDGEWVKKTLGEVCEMQAGKFVSASEINTQFSNDLYPCYGGNGLRGYTKSYTHTGTYSLIGRQGALCGNVTLADSRFHATEHAVVVTPGKSIDTVWLFYVLELLNLNQYATGQAQPGLSVSNLERVKLSVPLSFNEQQKIASCLSACDELIAGQTAKIEQLKQHKKGLMQGLFPKMND